MGFKRAPSHGVRRRLISFAAPRWAGVCVLALALAVAGCAVGPDYHRPDYKVPGQFGAATQPSTQPSTQPTTQPVVVDLTRWWESFGDAQLNSLVERAVNSNLTVQVAELRLREARYQLQISRSGLFPVANASGSYQHARFSKNGFYLPGSNNASGVGSSNASRATGSGSGSGSSSSSGLASAFNRTELDTWQAGFDASWEIDIFGGVRREIEAARADEAASLEARRDAMVTLLAEVARNYIDLRGAQLQLSIARENVRSQQDTVELTRSRFAAGLNSDLDVARAEAQVASTRSQIPVRETQIQQDIHRLSVLLAQPPNALEEELIVQHPLPSAPPEVPIGLPSELLRRRPDVRQAERQLAAANARIGAATADLFPRFALTGGVGLAAGHPSDLFNSSSIYYSIGPQINWRIFDAGRIRANVSVQTMREQEAMAQYQSTILRSLEDVENALVGYNEERQRWQFLREAVAANRRAVDLAGQLYTKGLTDFLNVLEAQRNLFASQDLMAQSEETVSANVVALYKALGGGWESQEQEEQAAKSEQAKR
ncbi:MAG TPA: efflux transporter outer membrane subunit [Humisphaera sp.]|nr:efflux transporter outer membrane subunit [Humisphaera sp.]